MAIADVNEAGLEETADKVRRSGVQVTTHAVDVANREQVKRYTSEVVKAHGSVHLIINNSGVCIVDTMEDVSYEDFEWLIDINLWGVIYGCKEFLPYLKKQQSAHIVNISSVNGIFTNPIMDPTARQSSRSGGSPKRLPRSSPIPTSKSPVFIPAVSKLTLLTTPDSTRPRTPP